MKSFFDNIKSFEVDKNKNHIFGIKSAIIWGHSKDTNGQFPLLYIQKPKHISDEEYKEILEWIEIKFICKPK